MKTIYWRSKSALLELAGNSGRFSTSPAALLLRELLYSIAICHLSLEGSLLYMIGLRRCASMLPRLS